MRLTDILNTNRLDFSTDDVLSEQLRGGNTEAA